MQERKEGWRKDVKKGEEEKMGKMEDGEEGTGGREGEGGRDEVIMGRWKEDESGKIVMR